MVYNIKKSEELFKLKLSVVCDHGIQTHSAHGAVDAYPRPLGLGLIGHVMTDSNKKQEQLCSQYSHILL